MARTVKDMPLEQQGERVADSQAVHNCTTHEPSRLVWNGNEERPCDLDNTDVPVAQRRCIRMPRRHIMWVMGEKPNKVIRRVSQHKPNRASVRRAAETARREYNTNGEVEAEIYDRYHPRSYC